MLRTAAVLAIATVLSVAGALGLTRGSDEPQELPAPGGTSVVVGAGQDLATTIDALQQRLRSIPQDSGSWATLGLAYVEQARVSGNPTFYGKAEQALARSFAEQPEENFAAYATASALASARHDFGKALAEAEAALAINPRDAQALAIRVDALTELGRYREQLSALRQADNRQPGVPIVSRYSYAFELRGNLAKARNLLVRSSVSASHADRGFLLTQAAELDRRLGRLDVAQRRIDQALRESPGYVPALVSRARLSVAQGRLALAERRWQDVVTRLPLPEYLVELGELLLARGDEQGAQAQFDVVRTTVQLFEDSGVDTDLETALFEADHGSAELALSLARDEWSKRRSIQVADALAWALHANGKDRRALGLAEQATRLGATEARLWLHRGLIEAELGKDAAATRHLRYGLAADRGVSPWQSARARDALDRMEQR